MTLLALLLPLMAVSPVLGAEDFWRRYGIANAILQATDNPDEQRVLMLIALHESSFRAEVIDCRIKGDGGKAHGAYQVHPRSRAEEAAACGGLDEQTELALARVRESLRACRHMPKAERLGIYTDGRCDSAKAKRQSRERWGQP